MQRLINHVINHGKKIGKMAKIRRTSNLDQQIDANLRRVYSETLNQPLPDRFTQLLQQLQQQQNKKSEAESEDGE